MKPRPHKQRTMKTKVPQPLMPVNPDTGGIDIGSTEVYVAVSPDRDEHSVRSFPTFTRDLHELARWLQSCRITSVAMESTGVYWIPLFNILESYGIEVCLINPRQSNPVKKTDVSDCQWLQQMHSYGLLKASFRPPQEIRALRTLSRQREMLLRYRAKHMLHMQKALHQMNIQLDNVISDITGTTGLAILRAIVQGERDLSVLVHYRDPRCQCSEEEIRKSLEGSYLDEHLFELTQALELYDFYSKKILDCDQRIQSLYTVSEASPHSGPSLPPSKKAKKRARSDPPYDLRALLYRLCGVDLTQVDGLNVVTVQTIITELGVQLHTWPSAKQFASWLGLSPNNKITGGKVIKSESKKTTNRATQAFRLAARSLHHSQSALGAFYRRQQAKHGPAIAIKATAHKLARIVYTMLTTHTEYRDLGEHYYVQHYQQRIVRNLKRTAANFGLQLVPMPPGVS